MKQNLGTVAVECILDLGITVVYAVIVGFVIVGVVASDEGPASILTTSLCAFVLPGAALTLVAAEIMLRLFKESRAARAALVPIPLSPAERRSQAFGAR